MHRGQAGGEGGCASWECGEPRELLEARVCVRHICMSMQGYFLSSPSVSCEVHIMVRLFPDPLAPQSCFHKRTRGVDSAESASRQRSRAHSRLREQTFIPRTS